MTLQSLRTARNKIKTQSLKMSHLKNQNQFQISTHDQITNWITDLLIKLKLQSTQTSSNLRLGNLKIKYQTTAKKMTKSLKRTKITIFTKSTAGCTTQTSFWQTGFSNCWTRSKTCLTNLIGLRRIRESMRKCWVCPLKLTTRRKRDTEGSQRRSPDTTNVQLRTVQKVMVLKAV